MSDPAADPARRILRWGSLYVGRADLCHAAEAIRLEAGAMGLHCASRELDADTLLIEGTLAQPFRGLRLLRRPHRADWLLRRQGDRLLVAWDRRLFPAYAAALGIFGLLDLAMVVLFMLRFDAAPISSPAATLSTIGVVAALLGIMACFAALEPLGGTGTTRLWLAVGERLRAHKDYLMPAREDSWRWLATVVPSLILSLAVVAWAGTRLSRGVLNWRSIGLLEASLLGGCLLTLLIVIALITAMVRIPGLRYRTGSMMPGLCAGLAMIALLMIQGVWTELPVDTGKRRADIEKLWKIVDSAPTADEKTAPLTGIALRQLESMRRASWTVAGLIAFLAFMAALPLHWSFRFSLTVWPRLLFVRNLTNLSPYRDAAGADPRLLKVFRGLFLGFWTAVSIAVLVSLAAVAVCTVQIASGSSRQPGARVRDLSTLMAALACNRPPGDPRVDRAVAAAWTLYGAAVLSLPAASATALLVRRRRDHRRLREILQDSTNDGLCREILARFERIAEVSSLTLVISPGAALFARSVAFGLFPRRRYIEISRGCLAHLSPPELEAILAHEYAHHLKGHTGVDSCLLWLGRITMVGDGFARTFQNTFGYELEADNSAVDLLGADPAALRRALQTMRHTTSLGELARRQWMEGVRAMADPEPNPTPVEQLPWKRTGLDGWKLSVRLFLALYLEAPDIHYWHPSVEERIRRLTERAAERSNPETGCRNQ